MTQVGLELEDLTVAFGGNVVVSSISIGAPRGSITGLIGPNGAGKTTTFNACSGLIRPRQGRIRLLGRDISGWSPHRRARSGLGRTFQRLEFCAAMSVRDNVAIGAEARMAGASLVRQFTSRRIGLQARVDDAIERCGLTDVAEETAGSLPSGKLRLVELARVVASGFSMLLLDEPSSGLDDVETDGVAGILRSLVSDLGLGILLVEHDVDLVMALSSHIYVMDFGSMIFEGSPAEVRRSALVRAAYLGDALAEVEP